MRHLSDIRLLIIFILVLGAFPGLPQERPASAALEKLRNKLEALQHDNLVQHGLVAFSVRSVKTGNAVLEFNASRSAIPASTQKLLTTATALSVLGEEFTYATQLEYDGVLKNGVLQGNLYIRGSGDPTLGSDRFTGYPALPELMQSWVTKIKAAGIRQINGAIVGDAGIFEENAPPATWVWGDMGNYYGASAYGLNLNENLYRLIFQPGKTVGSPAKVLRTEPLVPHLSFTNQVTTGAPGSGDQCYLYGVPYQDHQFLQGTVPAGMPLFTVRGSVPDPPYLCAFNLHGYLRKAGVVVRDSPTTDRRLRQQGKSASRPRTVLHTQVSPPLRDIVQQTNFMSINLYAEALLKTIAGQPNGEGSTEKGVQVLEEYWRKKGVLGRGWFIKDGSGLSAKNGITATQMTDMLRLAAQEPVFSAFYASIPVVGVSGTVKGLCKGSRAVNNVHAKSGTSERVKCYAGYFTSSSGELMSFAFFVNNFETEGKRIPEQMEEVLTAMAEL